MENNDKIWQKYYQKVLSKAHAPRTEFAIKLNKSKLKIAIDMGCGTGSDSAYMAQLGYQVHTLISTPSLFLFAKNVLRMTLKLQFQNQVLKIMIIQPVG